MSEHLRIDIREEINSVAFELIVHRRQIDEQFYAHFMQLVRQMNATDDPNIECHIVTLIMRMWQGIMNKN